MLSIPPVLSSFPFITVHSLVNLYAVLWFGLLHALALGIFQNVERVLVLIFVKCVTIYVSNEVLFFRTKSIQGASKNRLKATKWSLEANKKWWYRINEKNLFLQTQEWGPTDWLSHRNGYILGMLDGKDYENIDLVLLFFEKLLMFVAEIQRLLQW